MGGCKCRRFGVGYLRLGGPVGEVLVLVWGKWEMNVVVCVFFNSPLL